MVKLAEISRTSTFAWSHDALPLLVTGTVAGAVDANFSLTSTLELWQVFEPLEKEIGKEKSTPIVSANVDARFHVLDWLKPFGKYEQGVIAGGFESGAVEFWDAKVLLSTKDLTKALIFKKIVHQGPVKALLFHPTQLHVVVTGGSHGQIFLWDLKTLGEPTGPGQAMTPMDEITSVAWNQQIPHIFASTGNSGYTSVWDLKAKREVLHLQYLGSLGRANFSSVAWHPTLSTKLVTASDNDSCPLILTWDLRNANAPEKIMQGHTKGVLSLDWCSQDPELLISSGKDNATFLWNPILGQKLGEFPTTANWAFKTEFSPSAPDIFATALFDGKILVQLLQDTSPPALTKATKSTNDNDFWNEISSTDTQQPVFEIKQAPAWLKRPSSVSFGFGSKLVVVKTENGTSKVDITKISISSKVNTSKLAEALKADDFKDFIDEKINSEHINNTSKNDWNLLKKLQTTEKSKLLNSLDVEEKTSKEDGKSETANGSNGSNGPNDGEDELDDDVDDSFFANLGTQAAIKSIPTFVPEGSFKISTTNKDDDKLSKLVLGGKIDEAVTTSIEQGKLLEALILALSGSEASKSAVRNEYFKKNKDNSFSRILYSATSKNITDIVSNADVTDWKEIASSISAYAIDAEDYNSKITELGDRILKLESHSREDALLCYLAGNALDKIAAIWLQELPEIQNSFAKAESGVTSPADARFEALNEFVEKLVAYKSISKLNGGLSGPQIEPTCKVILEYASLVASSGEFELADKFLDLLPADFEGLKLEKDRVAHASGKVATAAVSGKTGSGVSPNKSRYARTGSAAISRSPISNHVNPIGAPQFGSRNGVSGGYTPTGPIAPPTNNFAPTPTAPGNSFAPSSTPAFTKPKVSNPYAPANLNLTSNYHNPYKPQVPAVPTVPAIPTPGSAVAPPPPTTAAFVRKDTEGWNDLPENFKPKIAPRRSAASSPAIGADLAAPPTIPQGPKRVPSTTGVPGFTAPPPKGVSRSILKLSVIETSEIPSSPVLSTKYAPPPSAASPVSITNSSPKVGGPTPAPKNPYAPPPAAPVSRTSFASPVINSNMFVSNTPSAPPPKNPYAPPPSTASTTAPGGIVPPPQNFAPPPPVNNFAPPPPVNNFAPPPPVNNFAPPPPVNNFAAPPPPTQNAVPPPPKAASAPPPAVAEKYPAGDRSHIPEVSKPIYDTLNGILELIMPNLPEQYAKHGEAVVKRLNVLFDHLNNQDLLTSETIEALKGVCAKLDEKDFQSALALHIELGTKHSEETGNWHSGVKHLIQMAEALY